MKLIPGSLKYRKTIVILWILLILTPEKSNSFVLLGNQNCVKSVKLLFKDQKKIKVFDKDAPITQMKTLKNSL